MSCSHCSFGLYLASAADLRSLKLYAIDSCQIVKYSASESILYLLFLAVPPRYYSRMTCPLRNFEGSASLRRLFGGILYLLKRLDFDVSCANCGRNSSHTFMWPVPDPVGFY